MTGGANGIGRAIAVELARQGCNVAVVDINFDEAQNTCDDLCKLGIKAYAYQVIEPWLYFIYINEVWNK